MHLLRVTLYCIIALTVLALSPALAENAGKVDVGKFALEMTQIKMNGTTTEMAIWMPYEFFVAATMADGTTRQDAEKDLAVLKAYQFITVRCSIDNPDGTSKYTDEKAVFARASLQLADGKTLAPLPDVPPMVKIIIDAMKTMFASEGDAGGKSMHVLVFPAKTPAGKEVVNAATRDSLTLVLNKTANYPRTVFTWHTPIDAVTGEKSCSQCHGAVSAKWQYCPWCGEKLP